jgi:hypothetical protein
MTLRYDEISLLGEIAGQSRCAPEWPAENVHQLNIEADPELIETEPVRTEGLKMSVSAGCNSLH